ncbi:hypothetical protein QS257_08140 [Terrilactibacillus sp. S3-3]|nr:hypothetical protein QS257_08140 [Terrilactibacillus sp. S3-3]
MVDPELFSLVIDGGEKYQRAALLERGSVVSFYLKKKDESAEAGNIYLGKVADSRPRSASFFFYRYRQGAPRIFAETERINGKKFK